MKAQDVHFSQYYAMPIFQNPAFTGFFNGDVRVAADFRMQWETFGSGFGNAFRTGAFAADFGFLKAQTQGSTLGAGITFINDQAGDLKLMTNQVGLALNYVQAMGREGTNYLAAGFHGTFTQRSIDLTDAVFPDQVETDIGDNHNFFNFSAGLLWFFQPSDQVNMFFGGAMHNIIRPNVSFFDGVDEELDRRISAQFGSQFNVSRSISLVPSLLYQKQGPSQEMVLGTFVKYSLGGYTSYDNMSLQLGAFYRFSDAIIPVVRFDIRDLSIIASYDVNISKLTAASGGEGGAEISLTWTGLIWSTRSKVKPIRCPIL
jgi:type IX secretion system PorP/SprF family membrane protein